MTSEYFFRFTKKPLPLFLFFVCALLVQPKPRALAQGWVLATGEVSPIPTGTLFWSYDIPSYQELIVGENALGFTGTLVIHQQGVVSGGMNAYIGKEAGANGWVSVQDPGSQWNMSLANYNRYVGYSGTGSLFVGNGGSVSGFLTSIGHNATGSGSVTVTGAGSELQSPWLIVGYSGDGELTVSDGGYVSGSGYIGSHYIPFLGEGGGGTGKVTVTGAGSVLEAGLVVGSGGRGELRIENGGRVIGGNQIGADTGSEGYVLVTGSGSEWNASAFDSMIVAHYGKGELVVRDGGVVSSGGGNIGNVAASEGHVLVEGAASEWNMQNVLYVGNMGRGELAILNGGRVSNGSGFIAQYDGSVGTVTVSGTNALWNNNGDLIIGGYALHAPAFGSGELNIASGGEVRVDGLLKIWSAATVSILVSNDDMLRIGGNLGNEGLIRLSAGPGLSAGTYTPIDVAGTWSGSGSYEALGGVWDADAHEFLVAAAALAAAGSQAAVDLAVTQRLEVSGLLRQMLAAFDADGEAVGGGSSIVFTATENGVGEIGGREVLSAWDFETDLAFGTEVQLSLEIGEGWEAGLLQAWHSEDGVLWTLFDTEILYSGAMATFVVDGFSSYAITVVPEPSAWALFGASLMLFLLMRRRSRAASMQKAACENYQCRKA